MSFKTVVIYCLVTIAATLTVIGAQTLGVGVTKGVDTYIYVGGVLLIIAITAAVLGFVAGKFIKDKEEPKVYSYLHVDNSVTSFFTCGECGKHWTIFQSKFKKTWFCPWCGKESKVK